MVTVPVRCGAGAGAGMRAPVRGRGAGDGRGTALATATALALAMAMALKKVEEQASATPEQAMESATLERRARWEVGAGVGAAVVGVPAACAAPRPAALSVPPPQAAAATLAKLAESHAGIADAMGAASTDIGGPVCTAVLASARAVVLASSLVQLRPFVHSPLLAPLSPASPL